jgi:hypothetical protein
MRIQRHGKVLHQCGKEPRSGFSGGSLQDGTDNRIFIQIMECQLIVCCHRSGPFNQSTSIFRACFYPADLDRSEFFRCVRVSRPSTELAAKAIRAKAVSTAVRNHAPLTFYKKAMPELILPLLSSEFTKIFINLSDETLSVSKTSNYGLMFWFTRNRLVGSYLRLISTKRA